jgi:thymidylate synthase ThyX
MHFFHKSNQQIISHRLGSYLPLSQHYVAGIKACVIKNIADKRTSIFSSLSTLKTNKGKGEGQAEAQFSSTTF